jgi:murein DD-endopeptidase MepM/ murein hydrolase activator NlpD
MNKKYRRCEVMDDIMVRSRYPRHSAPARRRKRYTRERNGNSLLQTIMRQLIISLLILLVAGIVKSINTPVTNYITDKIQYVLKQNIELKSIYEYVDGAIGKLKDNSLFKNNDVKLEDTVDKAAVAESADSSAIQDNTTSPESSVLSASTEEGTAADISFIAPVKGVVSSLFGNRTDPANPASKVLKFHEGIDIDAARGESILAVLAGTVIDAGSSPSYGKYVRIRHAGGLETVYAHCSELNVVQGHKVKQGDIIAKVGDSGVAVGVHLHFEVWKDGIAVDPLNYTTITKQ